MKNDIVIVFLPIDTDNVFEMSKEDAELTKAITGYGQEISKNGIEIFKQKGNIIVAEDGYYAAFYECDLRHADAAL